MKYFFLLGLLVIYTNTFANRTGYQRIEEVSSSIKEYCSENRTTENNISGSRTAVNPDRKICKVRFRCHRPPWDPIIWSECSNVTAVKRVYDIEFKQQLISKNCWNEKKQEAKKTPKCKNILDALSSYFVQQRSTSAIDCDRQEGSNSITCPDGEYVKVRDNSSSWTRDKSSKKK